MSKIEFFKHNLTQADFANARRVMESIFLTTGAVTERFEKKFASYLGLAEAVGLTSCTGGLHLALLRHGIGPGDEVITTPMTFVATILAILEAGATPVLVDVCPRSGLLRPEDVEPRITRKTKALLPVHLYGRMVDMKGFARIAKAYGLIVIEDAAHCIEGWRDGVRPGELSQAACFSFYATKSITCGEGGALACRSAKDAAWYRSARHHGISKGAADRYTRRYEHWDLNFFGWKYNPSDIQVALLEGQIDRLEDNRNKREILDRLYRHHLQDTEGLDLLEEPRPGERSGHHLFTILVPRTVARDRVLARLQAEGIGCAVNYRAVHNLSYIKKTFGFKPSDFPVADDIGNRTISLPLYPKLSERNVERVCRSLKRILSER
jgi:dTDP-4-amino-4,6-dideoxygalactose transaminase